jgi:hypothetical protein
LNPRLLRQAAIHVPFAMQEEFQHGGSREDGGGHEVRVRSASREAQFAFYSVVLSGPPCFLRVENLGLRPTATVAATQDQG